jgi:hypothetical protein
LARGVEEGEYDGPVSANGACLPPRASFFGARSLSLVLADFGTLLFFFLLLILDSLFLVLLFGAITSRFWIIRIHAKVSKASKELKKLPLFSVNQQVVMERFVTQNL